jgi:hypothetical protein
MKNPYIKRWQEINQEPEEAPLVEIEIDHALQQGALECGKCGELAYYRPGIGAHQCSCCGAVLSYSGQWR